jgi:hypothetical protein
VVSPVKQAGAGQAGGGTADRGDRHARIKESAGGVGERRAAAQVPHLGTRQDQQIAVSGVEFGNQRIGGHADSAHRGDGFKRLGHRDDVEPHAGEPSRTQFRKQVTDLPVGECVVEAEMCSPVAVSHVWTV